MAPSRRHRGARVATMAMLALLLSAVGATSAHATGSQDHAALSITKQTDPAGDTSPFDFKVEFFAIDGDSGPNSSDEQPPASLTIAGGQTVSFPNIHKGYYKITEVAKPGWKLTSIVCAPDDVDPKDTPVVDLAAGSVVIEVSGDEQKGCTFVNRKQPVLRVVKRTVPAGSTAVFGFTPGTNLGGGAFSLTDGQAKEYTLDPGTYTVTEPSTTGWSLQGAVCDDADSSVSGATATAVLSAGEVVTCTFTNAQAPVAAPVTAAGGPASTPTATTPVVKKPTARLSVPARCVTQRYTVAVRGGNVTSVTWSVNGRKVRTTKAKKGQQRFTVQLAPGARVQRIVARVAFSNAVSPRSRTLRATVRRCSAAAVTPRFTG